MADMTPTTAFAHAPATDAKTTLRGAFDTLMTAIDTFYTTATTGTSQVYTLAISGTPTGGTYDITIEGDDEIAAQTITLAYNAAASAVQTALRALVGDGLDQTTVSATGSGANLTHTITFKGTREDITLTADVTDMTGGSPARTVTETTAFTVRPFFSATSKEMAKQRVVDLCEEIASNCRA
jgi:hypothetical protein